MRKERVEWRKKVVLFIYYCVLTSKIEKKAKKLSIKRQKKNEEFDLLIISLS